MTCVVKIFFLNPLFVHFVLVYVLKTVEGKTQSGTKALGGPAGLGESKDEGIASVKPSPNTNEVCKENSKTKNILYLYLTCVVKIARRKFSSTPNSLFFCSFWSCLLINYLINNYCSFFNFRFCCLF